MPGILTSSPHETMTGITSKPATRSHTSRYQGHCPMHSRVRARHPYSVRSGLWMADQAKMHLKHLTQNHPEQSVCYLAIAPPPPLIRHPPRTLESLTRRRHPRGSPRHTHLRLPCPFQTPARPAPFSAILCSANNACLLLLRNHPAI